AAAVDAAHRGGVVGEIRAGPGRRTDGVGVGGDGDRAGRPAVADVGAAAGGGAVDLQVEQAGIAGRGEHLVHRQRAGLAAVVEDAGGVGGGVGRGHGGGGDTVGDPAVGRAAEPGGEAVAGEAGLGDRVAPGGKPDE